MKNIFISLIFLFAASVVNAQITIDQNDMPQPDDIYEITAAVPDPNIDLTETGPNEFWDFSSLVSQSVQGDTFIDPDNAPAVYQFVFNNPFNPGAQSTVAQNLAIDQTLGGTITLENVINFYHTSSSQFVQVGFGATVQGVQLPIEYDEHDILFELPLNYNDAYANPMSFQISIPGFAYYGTSQTRQCDCDGWGTVETPAGLFSALRLKCIIDGVDSVYLDTLGGGTSFTRPTAIEYKWLAKNTGVPVLQINTQEIFGTEQITQVDYLSWGFTGVENLIDEMNFEIFPNPADQFTVISGQWPENKTSELKVFDLKGDEIYSTTFDAHCTLLTAHWSDGIYFVKIKNSSGEVTGKLFVSKKQPD